MRAGLLTLVLVVVAGIGIVIHARRSTNTHASASTVSTSSATAPKTDFDTKVKPILQSRCQPCHFQGGKVYDKLPFDKPETVVRLGEKMFTRIQDKEEQRVIREFLAQP